VGGNSQFFRELAVAEDFDAVGTAIGETCIAEDALINASAVLEAIEGFQIDRQVTGGMPCVVETALGNAPDKGHLAAFKADTNRAAGTRRLALSAASAGFAVATGFTLAEAFAAVPGTGTRF